MYIIFCSINYYLQTIICYCEKCQNFLFTSTTLVFTSLSRHCSVFWPYEYQYHQLCYCIDWLCFCSLFQSVLECNVVIVIIVNSFFLLLVSMIRCFCVWNTILNQERENKWARMFHSIAFAFLILSSNKSITCM